VRKLLCLALLGALPVPVDAQKIDPARGVDPKVDYTSLTRHGPWDDRNYRLTAADVAVLPPGDADLHHAIPAYYRIHLRATFDLPVEGPAQYPLNALAFFFAYETGYLVDGSFYRAVERRAEGWSIDLDSPIGRLVDDATGTGAAATGEAQSPELLDGEARVTSPSSAAESAVAVHPTDVDRVIAGTVGPGPGQKMHFSTDGGATWTETELPLGGTCCDPTVAWSSDGSKAYAATLGGFEVWFYRSGDGGQTWDDLAGIDGDPRRELAGIGLNDKEFLHVDTSAASPHRDAIYLTWHAANIMRVGRSIDGGHTWSTYEESPDAAFLGVGSDLTSDRGGRVYHVWPAYNSRKIWVSRSIDGGASFGTPVEAATTEASFGFPIPAMETRQVHTVVNTDVDLTNGPFADTVYLSWTDSTAPTGADPAANHARIQIAYSRDGGATWQVRTPHATADALTVDRFHPWLKVAPNGFVHVVFYDTRQDTSRELVDLYHSISEDGGDTWSAPERLTTVSSPDPSDGFEFGDYNGLDIVGDSFIGIFTDNRNEAGGGGDSIDVYVAGQDLATAIFADGFESGDTGAWDSVVE
jgi:hypothetical protein